MENVAVTDYSSFLFIFLYKENKENFRWGGVARETFLQVSVDCFSG